MGPLRFDKNGTPPDWQKWDPSGLEKIGTPPDWQKWDLSGLTKKRRFRIGKNGTPPYWQNWYPSGLAKMEPLRIGKIGTPPDWQNWDPSGLGPVRVCKNSLSGTFFKFSSDTLPDTISDAFMLFELTRRGVSSFPRPFRIEVKPLI